MMLSNQQFNLYMYGIWNSIVMNVHCALMTCVCMGVCVRAWVYACVYVHAHTHVDTHACLQTTTVNAKHFEGW